MLIIAYFVFVVLLSVGLVIGVKTWQSQIKDVVINNPAFLQFQSKYFRVYFLTLIAEWLQGPYLFKLYHDYGFVDPNIGIIYVCGYISSVVLGSYTGVFADRWGRKKVCVLLTVLYSICCLTKLSRNFTVLCIGRILGGISTSLLFSTFDAWYMYEHAQSYEFPNEWLDVTFSKATFYNSIIAISCGFFANLLSEWLELGPVSPFIVAIPFLLAAGITIQATWEENHGSSSAHACRGCMESLKAIVTNPVVLLMGAIQAMFESVMYIFVFLWTPVLQPANPPLGIIFSCFMCCIWIGGTIFEYLDRKKVSFTTVIMIVVFGVMSANIGAAYASANHPRASFFLFLAIEMLCGIYFPTMGRLRAKILPAALSTGIMNWFRVPLNIIASAVLLILHDSHTSHGISHMFFLCALLLFFGGLFSFILHMRLRNDESEEGNEEIL